MSSLVENEQVRTHFIVLHSCACFTQEDFHFRPDLAENDMSGLNSTFDKVK